MKWHLPKFFRSSAPPLPSSGSGIAPNETRERPTNALKKLAFWRPRKVERDPDTEEEDELPPRSNSESTSGVLPTLDGLPFAYSMCAGKKKALCIGINYYGQRRELRGCVNDARNVERFLLRHGYRQEDIVVLTDAEEHPRARPTRENILDAMRWLARDAQKHDTLFFHYSGHGKLVKDKNGDEIDGYDQALVPLDHRTAGTIIDDDIHDAMVKPLPIGCKLTVLCDSCHSGSILDVPYAYSSRGRLKDSPVTHKWHEYKSSTADVVSWSSCKDCQTSADIHKHGFPTGAMSYAFITALDRNPQPSYRELLRSTRALTKEYSQKPQLSSSHPIDVNIPFVL